MGSGVLRGREAELAAISALIEATMQGHSSLLVVEGRAGFGKSRLLRAAADHAAAAGLKVGTGRADVDSRAVPMMTMMSALFSGSRPVLDRNRLRDLPSSPEQRFWLLQELAALLEEAALKAPLLVALDDLQWADPGTLAAVRMLPAQLADLPVAWLVACRMEEGSAETVEAVRELEAIGARKLILGPLDDAAVRQVVTDMLAAAPDQPLLRLAGGTAGNPFLLSELLVGLTSEDRVRIADGTARLLGTQLPVRLRESMRSRLDRLSPAARNLAEVAAVLGRRFTHDQAAALMDVMTAALLGPVQELLRAGLLAEDDDRLAFGHDLVREAVLSTLPSSSRRALQRRAVDVFLAEGAPPVEVARQLADSAEPGDRQAIMLLSRAAAALQPSDAPAAADLAVTALKLADAGCPDRGSLAAQAAILLVASGRSAEGEALAWDALRELPSPAQRGQLCLTIAEMPSVPVDVRARACRSALDLAGVPDALRARLHARLAYSVLHEGKVEQARIMLAELDKDVVTDPATRFIMQVTYQTLAHSEGRYADVIEGYRTAAEGPHPMKGVFDYYPVVEALALRDDFDEALRICAARVAEAQRNDQVWTAGTFERQRGRLWAATGNLADAAAALDRISAGVTPREVANSADAAALLELGRLAMHMASAELSAVCADAARHALSILPAKPRQYAVLLLAMQQMAAGDDAAAHSLITTKREDGQPVLPTLYLDPADAVLLVRVALACGDIKLADEAITVAEHRRDRNPGIASLSAVAAHAHGLRDGDVAAIAQAVREFAQGPRRLALASATEDLGRFLVASGQTADGAGRLRDALALYSEMGATWDATRARARLRRLGIRRNLQGTRPAGNWAGLTDSELSVVRLVAAGHTNREVAERLFLSPYTVNSHLRHVFTKLGIRSRVDLVRVYATRPAEHAN